METWMVTGVTGFLGPRIVEALRRDPQKTVLPITRRQMDFTKEEEVQRAFDRYRPDVVVHAGAVSDTGACERDPEGTARVNVDGVRFLSRAAGELGARMIFASSDQVYQGSPLEEPHRETERLSPSNVYGRQKLLGEELVEKYCRGGISLRLTWMYDLPGELPVKPNFLINLMNALSKGETLLFSQRDFRGFTDARVVADRVTKLREIPGGVYNFGSPNERDTYATALETARLLGKDGSGCISPNPENPFRNLAFTTEKLERAGILFPDTITGIRDCLGRR